MDGKTSLSEPVSTSTQISELNNVDNIRKTKKNKILFGFAIVILLLAAGLFYFKPYISAFFDKKQSVAVTVTPTRSVLQITPTVEITPTSTATSAGTPNPTLSAKDNLKINDAYNSFGISLLKKITESESNKSVFISPLSLEMAFSMIMMGAATDVQKEMAKTLGYGNRTNEEISSLSTKYLDSVTSDNPDIIFSVANSIWIQKIWEKAIVPEFLSVNSRAFKARIEVLDLTNTEGVKTVNDWVSEQTKGKITKILYGPLSADKIMALVNAVYFKGNWTTPFDSKLTKEKLFTTGRNEPIKVEMMAQTEGFLYIENTNFQAVKIPYGNKSGWNMVIFLPKTPLLQFLKTASYDNWNKWQDEFQYRQGTIEMPRFKFEYELELNKIMSEFGMKLAFLKGERFPGMISGPAWIGMGIHKTYIDVNEEGTEAAAVTALIPVAGGGGGLEPFRMEINHPFFYAITDSNETIIFIGVFQEP